MNQALHVPEVQSLTKHRDTLLRLLSRRLEIAKANRNFQLIELLEQEKQQLITEGALPKASRSLIARFNDWVHRQVHAIAHNTELEAFQFKNGSDLWWYAFDPCTGRCVYADSEAELRLWIETNYTGDLER